jgi:hypothetical protein
MSFATSLEEQAAELERDAAALRKLSEVTRDLGEERVRVLLGVTQNGNGHTLFGADPQPGPVKNNSPRGREAVRLIVGERPGIWTLTDLRAEMKRRDWFTSNKGVDVAVTRLVASGEARRVGKGRYEFLTPDREEVVIESDDSAVAMIAA